MIRTNSVRWALALTLGCPPLNTFGEEDEGVQTLERGTTPFVLQSNLIIVDVEVNGRPAQFLLDTGAGTTVLTQELADRLGLLEADRTAGAGAGGAVTFSVVRVDSIRVAGITLRGVACPVGDISAVRDHVGTNVEGILGFDFFGSGTLSIDYPNKRVTFERPPEDESKGKAVIIGRTVQFPRFGVELTVPGDDWQATVDTPLPTVLAILKGPGSAEISISEAIIQGMSFDRMKTSMDASLGVQVENFERLEARDLKRTGKVAYRVRYSGLDQGQHKQFITEAILYDFGLLTLTCEAPMESFSTSTPAMESAFSSIRLMGPEPPPS